jgi:RHS repeat-associated protein
LDGSGKIETISINQTGYTDSETVSVANNNSFSSDFTYNSMRQLTEARDSTGVQSRNIFLERNLLHLFGREQGQLLSTHINRYQQNQNLESVQALSQNFNYSNNGNFLSRAQDLSDGTSVSIVNHPSGEVHRVFESSEANRNRFDVITEYDPHTRLPSKQQTDFISTSLAGIGGKYLTEYGYRRGCLTEVVVRDNSSSQNVVVKRFNFEYDGYGECVRTLVDGQVVSNKNYKAPAVNDPTSWEETEYVCAATGSFRRRTVYDRFGRVSGLRANGHEIATISYDHANRAHRITDDGTGSRTTYDYTYTDRNAQGRSQVTATISGRRTGSIVAETNVAGQPTHKRIGFRLSSENAPTISEYRFDYTADTGAPSGTLPTLLHRVNFPGGTNVTYGYDNIGRIRNQTRGGTATGETYNYASSGNNLSNNIQSIVYTGGISGTANYTYEQGQVQSITNERNHTLSQYRYDGLGRLVQESFVGDFVGMGFLQTTRWIRYNARGQISEIAERAGLHMDTAWPANPDGRAVYNYDNRGRLTGITTTGELRADAEVSPLNSSIAYSNYGNPRSYRGNELTWMRANNLTRYGAETEYVYDAFGVRQEKRRRTGNQSTLTHSYYTEGGTIHREERFNVNGQTVRFEYLYDATGVAGYIQSGGTFWYVKNAFGDVIAIVDSGGMVMVRYEYDAWGNAKVLDRDGREIPAFVPRTFELNELELGENVLGQLSPSLVPSTHPGHQNSFRWRGQYYDRETGNYYIAGRYYDPRVGRVLNEDFDEADAEGTYIYDSPDPSDIFPNNLLGTNAYPSFVGMNVEGNPLWANLNDAQAKAAARAARARIWKWVLRAVAIAIVAASPPYRSGFEPLGSNAVSTAPPSPQSRRKAWIFIR